MSDEYRVGRGKPPRHTQFKKNQSGNPGGRPKGSKNLITLFSEKLEEKVEVRGANGRLKKMKRKDLLIESVFRKALGPDASIKDAMTVIEVASRAQTATASANTDNEDLSPTQSAALEALIKRRKETEW